MLLALFGSVVELAMPVLSVMVVPTGVPCFTLTLSVNVTLSRPMLGAVHVIGPTSPTPGVVHVQPFGASIPTNVVLVGIEVVSVTTLA